MDYDSSRDRRGRTARILIFYAAAASVVGLALSRGGAGPSERDAFPFPSAVPWVSIGGCGVGGGGGGANTYPWIGEGVSGYILDTEARVQFSSSSVTGGGTENLSTLSVPLTLNFRPRSDFTFSLKLPLNRKGTVEGFTASGIGDLSLLLSKQLGASGRISLTGGVTVPSGRSDIHDLSHILAPAEIQLGGGMFGASLGAGYSIDRDWGLILLSGEYSGGLFYPKSRDLRYDEDLKRGVPGGHSSALARVRRQTFRYYDEDGIVQSASRGMGAVNDMGVMSPDNIGLQILAGWRGDRMMKSVGLLASIPLGHGSYEEVLWNAFTEVLPRDRYPGIPQAQGFVDSEPSTAPLYRQSDGTLTTESLDDRGAANTPLLDETGSPTYAPKYWTYGSRSYEVYEAVVDEGDSSQVLYRIAARKRLPRPAWMVLTPGFGLELSNIALPLFFSVTMPIELSADEGVGVKGFAAELGVKFGIW